MGSEVRGECGGKSGAGSFVADKSFIKGICRVLLFIFPLFFYFLLSILI